MIRMRLFATTICETRALSSIEPNQHRNEVNSSEECVGEFIVSGGDRPESFEFQEESLNEVTLAIECEVGFAWRDAIGFGRDHWGDSTLLERFDQGIGIIGFVGEKSVRFNLIQQGFSLAEIGLLAWGERNGDGIAERVDDDMNFGRQSAAVSADGLTGPLFFRAPALCWWARTTVESNIMYSLSRSSAKNLKIL